MDTDLMTRYPAKLKGSQQCIKSISPANSCESNISISKVWKILKLEKTNSSNQVPSIIGWLPLLKNLSISRILNLTQTLHLIARAEHSRNTRHKWKKGRKNSQIVKRIYFTVTQQEVNVID